GQHRHSLERAGGLAQPTSGRPLVVPSRPWKVRHEEHGDAEGGHTDQVRTLQTCGEQSTRDGQQEAGAVAGSVVGCHRAPMPDTVETVERSLDDLAAWTAAGGGHQPDAAGIMLESRIVEARVFAVQIPPRACFRGKRKQDAVTCVLSENLLYPRARRTARLRIIAAKTTAPNSRV